MEMSLDSLSEHKRQFGDDQPMEEQETSWRRPLYLEVASKMEQSLGINILAGSYLVELFVSYFSSRLVHSFFLSIFTSREIYCGSSSSC